MTTTVGLPTRRAGETEHDRRRRIVEAYQEDQGWWHSIDLGHGVMTTGYKTPEHLAQELEWMRFPDVRGRMVLDIGAWDGFYSFEAERRGAKRVVALDHFVWSIDPAARDEYVDRCREKGIRPQPFEALPKVWRPDTLPGKRGFDIAHALRKSKVRAIADDFMTMDLAQLGTFDVVFFLGVLYHLKDPIRALERLRSVTNGVAVIETEAIEILGCEQHEIWESYSGDQLLGDTTNWWAPNATALSGMCKAAGFGTIEVTHGPAPIAEGLHTPQHYRLFLHAYATTPEAMQRGVLPALRRLRGGNGQRPSRPPR